MQGVQSIRVEVATPRGVFSGDFPKTAKVSDVIDAAVNDRGLKQGDVFELVHEGTTLAPKTRTLVSFGFSDTVKLQLICTGSGV